MARELTRKHKIALYRDGFVVLPGLIAENRVAAARHRILRGIEDGKAARGNEPVFLALFNETDLRPLLEDALGAVRSATECQLATVTPRAPSDGVNEAGYRDRDTPHRGWHGHLDGLWNGAAPVHQDVHRPMTEAQLTAWNKEMGRNGCRKTSAGANILNFTALVAVALSDQTREGAGNVGLLKGAHHHMERFFRAQRVAGGPLGPDGPDWPRIDENAPNGAGLRHYPDAVREAFAPDGTTTADGKFWPRPTLLRLALGDAAIILHATPHSATRAENEAPRLMAYFRVSSGVRPASRRRVCPDALCDIWRDWPGMAEVVAEQRRTA